MHVNPFEREGVTAIALNLGKTVVLGILPIAAPLHVKTCYRQVLVIIATVVGLKDFKRKQEKLRAFISYCIFNIC